MLVTEVKQGWKQKRLGSIDYSANKLAFFAGYQDCTNCHHALKILLQPDDLRVLEKLYVDNQKREKLGVKMTKRLISHYKLGAN